MRIVVAAIIAIIALAGCQGVQHNTMSGKPEVTVKRVGIDRVKSAIVNHMINKGYTITADTPYRIQFDRPVDNMMAALVFGSRFNAQPNARVTYTFAEMNGSVRVVADLAIATNPGSGFESITPMNNNKDSEMIQEFLEETRQSLNDR